MNIAKTQRSVGRPRVFNEEAALEAVMDVFWRKGYEAASLTDLCQATGLHKGSLYQAFGGKHQLFMQALQHYADKEFNEVIAVVSDKNTPLTNIRAVVDKITSTVDDEKGCLIINSVVEMGNHNPDVQKAVKSHGAKRLEAMSTMIAAAQEAGEIRAELDAEELAKQLMMSLAGAAATVKGVLEKEDLYKAIHSLINYWQ